MARTRADAYAKALACDPMSAFGGVIALNREVKAELAEQLHEKFIEVLIAPIYEQEALDVLQQKEAIRILDDEERRAPDAIERDFRKVRGGLLVQDRDGDPEPRELMEVVTETSRPTRSGQTCCSPGRWSAMCARTRSCSPRRASTIGIGAGQMSRVDSVRLAIDKCREARQAEADGLLSGSVIASDAFFPFADGPQAAIDAGATAVIQPGGSKRDAEVIEACEKAGVAMVFTKHRHFRH